MKHSTFHFSTFAFSLLILLCGCRREDIREYTFSIPGLTEANKSQIVQALSKYNGVQKDSYVWDFQKKTLTLKYDSMQIARTNIRMAIESKGIKVDFPASTTGKAGYVDTHE